MATDPRRLRPSEFCQLVNSTPLGEVINVSRLKRQRTSAGLRIGDGRHVDLLRYVAWLVQVRHAPPSKPPQRVAEAVDLAEAARGAAVLGSTLEESHGDGQRLSSKQETAIAALLTEATYASAASKAGVSESTLYRWLRLRAFRAAYRHARRELVETAIGRIQAGSGQAVETLLHVARQGRRDSDRVRAAVALLNFAAGGLRDEETLHGATPPVDAGPMNPGDVVAVLGTRLRQLESSSISTAEKARLAATLADTLLRAIGVDVIDRRLEAVQSVLLREN